MRKLFILLLLCCLPGLAVAEQLQSGLAVGADTPAYHPTHITGPDAGTDVCPVWKYALRPACQVFVQGASDEDVRSLIRTLSAAVKDHSKVEFKGFIFFVDGDPEKLKVLAREENADNIALGVMASDHEGVELYQLNPKAKTTVLLYEKRLVEAKMVDYNAKTDQKALVEQIDKLCR